MFGTTAAPSGGGFGGFGAPAAQPSFGGFGSASTSFAPAASGGFGAPTTNTAQPSALKPSTSFGGFGQPSVGFGSTPAASATAPQFTSFGAPATNQTQMGFQTAPAAPAQQAPGKIARSIEKLQQAYAPYQDNSGKVSVQPSAGRFNEDCFFKTVMYDKRSGPVQSADPSLTGSLLEQAEMNNPDPSRYIPVSVIGIDALKLRFDQQQSESQKLKEHIRSLREVIEAVDLSNTQMDTRFSALQRKQIHIYQRLMGLLRKVEVLRCRGSPIENSEVKYREMLQRILAAMKGPYLEIQELSNNVHQQEAPQDVYALVFDESELESLYDALRRQREGLEYITEILTKDIRDVSIVRTALKDLPAV